MQKTEKEFTCETIERLGVLSVKGCISTEVNLVSICGGSPMVDIRHWYVSPEGARSMRKGVVLSVDDAKVLAQVLINSKL